MKKLIKPGNPMAIDFLEGEGRGYVFSLANHPNSACPFNRLYALKPKNPV